MIAELVLAMSMTNSRVPEKSCATVKPLQNQVRVVGDDWSYTFRYWDMGDYIDYDGMKFPPYVRGLVENRKGTGIRRGCGMSVGTWSYNGYGK